MRDEKCEFFVVYEKQHFEPIQRYKYIHCFPGCNNHGKLFKQYAGFINQKLNYNIQTVGNKKEDYKKSNLEYIENQNDYKYKIICEKYGLIIYRQRLKANFYYFIIKNSHRKYIT